jgi:predicted TIM-barrel fold metal-dependent hydrolase
MKTANDKKIIDIHAHAFSLDRDKTGCFVSKKLMNSLSFRVIKRFFGIRNSDSPGEIERKVNKKTFALLDTLTTIDHVVMVAFDGIYDKVGNLDEENTHFYIANDYVRDLANAHEKVLYGASVNPNRSDSLDELERVIRDGAALIKWLPNTHGIAPEDKRYTDFYRMLAKNNMPLLVHTGNEYALHSIDQSFGDFHRLEPALKEGVNVIAAHGGGIAMECRSRDFDKLIGFLKEYDNFYIDTAAMFLLNKRRFLYKLSRVTDVHHKIVFGSDWPVPSNPVFFFKGMSPVEVIRMALTIKNSIERNLALTKKLNFSDEIFYTGYEIIKKDKSFENT